MAIGTQMTKVALSTLIPGRSYTVNGEDISATEMRDNIMDAIKQISTIGVEQIEKRLFKDNGKTLDVQKFSELLQDELASRGAPQEVLDSVGVHIENGTVKLNSPLLALSEMNWIESIINSIVNKQAIDINVPGEAFYQRSVWGMEGKPQVLSDEDLKYPLNNGEPLQMINEEGSMDCVLSIDYFYDILKELGAENKSFEEQKKLLIKHGIIGKSANMIGYRIPTQAISSIHALRCVDVLPTVRHTVILPAEFTKITGSDKRYHCSNQYNIKNHFNCWELLNQLRQSAAKSL